MIHLFSSLFCIHFLIIGSFLLLIFSIHSRCLVRLIHLYCNHRIPLLGNNHRRYPNYLNDGNSHFFQNLKKGFDVILSSLGLGIVIILDKERKFVSFKRKFTETSQAIIMQEKRFNAGTQFP